MRKGKLLVVNFSGGRTSAMLCRFVQMHPKYKNMKKLFIFANTSKELPETIDFVKACDVAFGLNLVKVEAKFSDEKGVGTSYTVVNYEDLKMQGEIYERLLQKYGLPTFKTSSCTRELKINPIEKYIKSLGDYNVFQVIGIRYDERHRVSKRQRDLGRIYPFIDDVKMVVNIVRSFWARQPFDLQLESNQGNCDLCFKKSLKKRAQLVKQNPHIADWWHEMEVKYSSDRIDKFDIRQNLYVSDVVELSKVIDSKHIDKYRTKSGGKDIRALDLDVSYDCMCSSS